MLLGTDVVNSVHFFLSYVLKIVIADRVGHMILTEFRWGIADLNRTKIFSCSVVKKTPFYMLYSHDESS